MITLANQLVLQFNIGNITDFLDIENFYYMRIAENTGGLRPIINLEFKVHDQEVINYLNSGNIITIRYGMKELSSDALQFEIMGDQKTKEYKAGSKISILGAMYNRSFTSQKKSDVFYNKKSYEALNVLATRNNLKFISNVPNSSKTIDTQNWYQCGLTDWNMTKYVAERSYKDKNTFFAYGFDNNNLYFYDIREHIKQGAKWILTVNHSDEGNNSAIVNIGTYHCDDSNAGTNADFAGKNITNISYNLDTGIFGKPEYELKTLTTMDTKSVNVNSTDCKNYNYQVTTLDSHPYTNEAQNQNFRNNVLFSSYTCHVPIAGTYRDFRLLDVVQLLPADSDKEAEGYYIITGISKEYKDRQYSTILTLNRESANGIRGDLEQGTKN